MVKRFKQSQRFRVILGDVCFYATAKQIRYGVGDFMKCNAALQKALDSLEYMPNSVYKPVGAVGTWEGLTVQINVCNK